MKFPFIPLLFFFIISLVNHTTLQAQTLGDQIRTYKQEKEDLEQQLSSTKKQLSS
jgi:hypothetical protein